MKETEEVLCVQLEERRRVTVVGFWIGRGVVILGGGIGLFVGEIMVLEGRLFRFGGCETEVMVEGGGLKEEE